MQNDEWKAQIERERQDKDAFLAEHDQSPLSPQDRDRFQGLDYFPVDPDYVFQLEFHEHQQKRIVTMPSLKGGEQDYLTWGEFRFTVDGRECTLQAYKSAPYEAALFVLFRDATCGKETYGAGRYLDLLPQRDRTDEGKWVLDFNRAYSPTCAYSEDYACPMVPRENWLDIPVPAGERYPFKQSEEGNRA